MLHNNHPLENHLEETHHIFARFKKRGIVLFIHYTQPIERRLTYLKALLIVDESRDNILPCSVLCQTALRSLVYVLVILKLWQLFMRDTEHSY